MVWFCLRISPEVAVRALAEVVSSEGLSGEGGAVSKVAHSWQAALVPDHLELSTAA